VGQLTDVFTDIVAEGEALDKILAGLDDPQWARPTPAPGWTVKHQVAHMASVFRIAGLAASDPDLFVRQTAGAERDFDAAVGELLKTALAALPPDQLVPWVARQLPASVLACAGMMELFAHGQDIADTVGAQREYTDRIGHLAWFATRNRDFGYQVRGLTPPEAPFRFELTAPSGKTWEFGPAEAEQRVTGPAADFCLLVTRRRHRDDLAVRATGADADQWLNIAQAYRGSPGPGRQPGQFSGTASA
jgi:uncharacterized protein (TIGR03083 family)